MMQGQSMMPGQPTLGQAPGLPQPPMQGYPAAAGQSMFPGQPGLPQPPMQGYPAAAGQSMIPGQQAPPLSQPPVHGWQPRQTVPFRFLQIHRGAGSVWVSGGKAAQRHLRGLESEAETE